ncbi:receptor-type tyrosine-protein phosphatase epsilon-like isoform X4 [Tenebrio molitor]|uniref:receptor-type tyrosine-protein phosphatase epsilon-like isoform X4 n=1 Tax=Tenebrio molitor TaxID=7067 RepID=UPI003624995D
MTNCKTFNNVSFILLFCTFAVCENSNSTKYCVVDGDSPGIFLNDGLGKDGTYVGTSSSYLDNSTVTLLLTEKVEGTNVWKVINSTESNHHINDIVIDERWETFKDNHDFHTEFHEILKNRSLPINFSQRHNGTEDGTQNGTQDQWYHLKLKNNKFECANISRRCYIPSNVNASQYYISKATDIWKLHNYTYLHTTQSRTETIYTKLENCTTVETGCFSMYLAMCPGCNITIQLLNSIHNNITESFIGNGKWKKQQFPLKKFTTCFNISITTNHISDETGFSAIGDTAYLSSNLSCEENKRYIHIDNNIYNASNVSNVSCENALNEKINITSSLPDYKKYSRNVIDKNATNVIEDTRSSDLATSSFNPLYLLIILPIVFIASVLIFVYFKKRKSKLRPGEAVVFKKNENEDTEILLNSKTDNSATRDQWPSIKGPLFSNYIHQVFNREKTSDDLKAQFESLPSGYLKESNEGKKPENLEKNRYPNILPYDENRVKLHKTLGDEHRSTDYINASYVQCFDNPKEYIVTQNPTEKTFTDFWRMIWQEKVEYIVMISHNDEKYYCYWPQTDCQMRCDGMEIYSPKVSSYEFYEHRMLVLQRFGESRKLNHLHFNTWSNNFLSSHVFAEFMNDLLSIPHHSVPVVFHCLGGLGRSATLVLCDIALREVASSGLFNLFEITKRLRNSRADMVQNLKQYQLAHLIIYENLNYRNDAIELNQDYEAYCNKLFEDNTIKKMWSKLLEHREWMFRALTPYIPCSDEPKKNRYQNDNNLLPVEHSRVTLQVSPDAESDYIHAMYVVDYKQKEKYIVAQQPLRNTLSDFWSMVIQNEVEVIINLNELNCTTSNDCCYFPTNHNKAIKTKEVTIELDTIKEYRYYNKFTLKINGLKLKKPPSVFNVKKWPKIKGVPDSTDLMLDIWDAIRKENSQGGRILFCCEHHLVPTS